MVWKLVKATFYKTCPRILSSYLHFNLEACRFNVNLINNGLEWHHDNVKPNQPDCANSIPGLTVVVHLGADDDPVLLQFRHDEKTVYKCVSGSMYVTPGYALSHRTLRPNKKHRRRYSIAIFFKFKHRLTQEADTYIHKCFPFTTDSYESRVYTV